MVTDAIIFDFDDTLVATNVIFESVREEFFAQMAALGDVYKRQCSDNVPSCHPVGRVAPA